MINYNFKTSQRIIEINRPMIMGILNVTPDSFSDGGVNFSVESAVESALKMVTDGADIIDIGGESTRPNSVPVSAGEELKRVIPVISELKKYCQIPLSIDTTKAVVAEKALQAGAEIVNDISSFKMDTKMAEVVAKNGAGAVLMHMRGTPQTMQQNLHYEDLISEIKNYFHEIVLDLEKAGVAHNSIIIDPGIGFSKNVAQNLQLIRQLDCFLDLNVPVMLGTSRKSFIGKILELDNPAERIWGTAATVALGVAKGAAIFRVHDVKEMSQVVKMAYAILD